MHSSPKMNERKFRKVQITCTEHKTFLSINQSEVSHEKWCLWRSVTALMGAVFDETLQGEKVRELSCQEQTLIVIGVAITPQNRRWARGKTQWRVAKNRRSYMLLCMREVMTNPCWSGHFSTAWSTSLMWCFSVAYLRCILFQLISIICHVLKGLYHFESNHLWSEERSCIIFPWSHWASVFSLAPRYHSKPLSFFGVSKARHLNRVKLLTNRYHHNFQVD